MSPPDAKTPPAWDRERPQDSSPGSDTDSIPPEGVCVRGDCRGEHCPQPCLIPENLDRLASAAERIAEALEAAVVTDGNDVEWWQIVVTS